MPHVRTNSSLARSQIFLKVVAATATTTADREQEEQHGAALGDREVRRDRTRAEEADDDGMAKATTSNINASIEKAGPQMTAEQAGRSAECGQVVVDGGKDGKQRVAFRYFCFSSELSFGGLVRPPEITTVDRMRCILLLYTWYNNVCVRL